jgi:hypothetical protein
MKGTEQGNANHQNQWNHIRLDLEGGGDGNSFAARRAKRIRQENTWSPTGEQLLPMISLGMKKVQK